jgi:hypothetical protein
MAYAIPTYGGYPIFGNAVSIVVEPNATAEQIEAFFGVGGNFILFGGARGRVFMISGCFVEDDIPSLNNDEFVFDPGNPNGVSAGGIAVLTDTRGRSWPNVYCKGEFKADPGGIHPAGGQFLLPYKLVMRGLS